MNRIKKYLKITLAFLLIIFLFQGCIAFHPNYNEKDELGFYVRHHYSCGPIALGEALNNLGEDVTKKQISQDIQSTGNLARKTISLIHYEGVLVTWPSEIRSVLKKYGYKTQTLKSVSELEDGDTAIILIRGSVIKREWHWMYYSGHENLEIFYSGKAQIIKIYKIIK